jgi:serine/threonine-protein kinase RsbT
VAAVNGPVEVVVRAQVDVEQARREAGALARAVGFSATERAMIVVAVSELATNLARYARNGFLRMSEATDEGRHGICIESWDEGPGIADLAHAMQDGTSTGGGLGSGLPAVRRMMDTFTISTGPAGTEIAARKWLRA